MRRRAGRVGLILLSLRVLILGEQMTAFDLGGSIPNFIFRTAGLIFTVFYSATVIPSYELAKIAVEKGDYASALSECKADASRGEAQCENLMGILYASGLGVQKDLNTSVEFFKKSAGKGNMKAQQSLAIAYMKGFGGVQQDQRLAFEWMLKSAEQGWSPAQLLVGSFYELGEGTEKSDAKAIQWWQKAANQDSAEPIAKRASAEARKGLEIIQRRLDTSRQTAPPPKTAIPAVVASTNPKCSIFTSLEINHLNVIFAGIRRCDGKTCPGSSSYFSSTGSPIGEWHADIVRPVMSRQRASDLQQQMPGTWPMIDSVDERIAACVPEAKLAAEEAIALARAGEPAKKLKEAYVLYMGMQTCFESRKNNVVKYVTSADLDIARNITKQKEGTLLKTDSGLSERTKVIWNSAEKEFSATSQIAKDARISGDSYDIMMSGRCAMLRDAFRSQISSQTEKRKKDF